MQHCYPGYHHRSGRSVDVHDRASISIGPFFWTANSRGKNSQSQRCAMFPSHFSFLNIKLYWQPTNDIPTDLGWLGKPVKNPIDWEVGMIPFYLCRSHWTQLEFSLNWDEKKSELTLRTLKTIMVLFLSTVLSNLTSLILMKIISPFSAYNTQFYLLLFTDV